MSELKRIIGNNIRRERMARNISIEELAEMLDLSPAFIGLIERGHRGGSLKNLLKISEIFQINIDVLVSGASPNSNAEDDVDPSLIENKKKAINSLLFELNENQMDFIISIIKDFRQYNEMTKDENL